MTLPLDEGNPFQKSPSFFRLLFFTTYWPFHQQLARCNKHPISQPVQPRITRVVRRDVWFTFYYANDLSGIFSGFWCEQSPPRTEQPDRTEYSEGKGESAFFFSSHMFIFIFWVEILCPNHVTMRKTPLIFLSHRKTKFFEWLPAKKKSLNG